MPDIRRALAALSPEERDAGRHDERYTFFRLADGGAVGSLGVELTPGRSIATDPHLVPLGSVAYLATRRRGDSS
jgi:membrane-bound lytic murein transglycosylase A